MDKIAAELIISLGTVRYIISERPSVRYSSLVTKVLLEWEVRNTLLTVLTLRCVISTCSVLRKYVEALAKRPVKVQNAAPDLL